MTNEDKVLRIGWASRDVSVDRPVGMRGQFHLRISEGVLDPVTVTALAISSEDDAVVFLSCDVVTIWPFMVRMVRDKTRALDPELPVEKIVMNATHTHEGGDVYQFEDAYETPPRMSGEEYQEFFANQAAEAVAEAWRGQRPGGVAWGYGFATVGQSRRVVFLDDTSKRPEAVARPGLMVNGHAVMYGNTNDPKFSHLEAGTDACLHVLFTYDADDTPTGALVNVPCPSQVDGSIWKLSADFWHETRVELRKRFGDAFQVLPQSAAAGDLSPRHPFRGEALQRRLKLKGVSERQDIAERIAGNVAEIHSWARKDIRREAELKHATRVIQLTRRPITREEYEAELETLTELEKQPRSTDPDAKQRMIEDSRLAAAIRRCRRVMERYESRDDKLPMELHVVRLGDIAFASNRFELFMDYGHRIQARSPATQTFVVQLAAGEVGDPGATYLPTARAEWGRGYSANHYSNLVNSTGGQELVDETVRTLDALFSRAL